ncbi:MAG: DUF4412 domain-containing protein [Saprospiraceae bacterium]
MKVKFLFTLILVLCTCVANLSFAQTRAEKKAKDRANQNVDRKIDESVDKAFNKIEGLFKKKEKKKEESTTKTGAETKEDSQAESKEDDAQAAEESQEMANNILKNMGMGNNEPWEPIKNDFPFSFDADITLTDKKGEVQKMAVKYVFDTWETGFRYTMEDGTEMQMILNNQEGSLTTVMDQGGEKQGFKMRQRKVNLEETDMGKYDDFKITKTGRSKTTEGGYFAHEYEIISEDGTGTTWITEDVSKDMLSAMQRAFSQYSNGKQKKNQKVPMLINYGIEGFPVENHFVDKNGKDKMDMIMKNLKMGNDIDKSPLKTDGVKIMSVGF